MRVVSLIFLILVSSNALSQNIIVNSSFEDTISCTVISNFGSIETAPPWKELVQSSDFASEDYCNSALMFFGIFNAHTGVACAGIGVYDSTSVGVGVREVFGQELDSTLVAGHTYCVSFYVSLAGGSSFAIDKVGALFTSFQPDGNDIFSFTLTPQIQNPNGNVLLDTINWTQVSGSFIAVGTEKFISIGNFFQDGNYQLVPVPWTGRFSHSYYYFDDISVIDCTVGLDDTIESSINLFPNPTQNILFVNTSINQPIELTIYNDIPQIVYRKTFTNNHSADIEKLANGIYFCQLKTLSGSVIKSQKLIKQSE